MPKQIDPTRSTRTQHYRTTTAAQLVARTPRTRTSAAELPEPQPPTYRPNAAYIEACKLAATLRPLTDVLSPRTLATLAAIVTKGGRTNGR